MRRKIKKLVGLVKQLDRELKIRGDIFWSKREKNERTDGEILQEVDNDFAIEKLSKEILTLCNT